MGFVAKSTFSVSDLVGDRWVGVLLAVAFGLGATASAYAQAPAKSDPASAQTSEVTKRPATAALAGATDDAAKSRHARRRERARNADEPKTASPESTSSWAVPAAELECRSIKVTGSRLGRRICATPASWAAVDSKGEEGVQQMRRSMDASAAATSANNSPYILGGP
jgi:hypothetical protein